MADVFIAPKTKATEVGKTEVKINNVSFLPDFKDPDHISHLSSFLVKPYWVSFQNQDDDENVLLFLRPHIITNLPWFVLSIILFLIPPILTYIYPLLSGTIFSITFLPERFTVILVLFYYLVVFDYFFISFLTWYFNISMVTQKRIVDIDYSDLVYHDVAVTKLDLIEDVNYTQTGFIRSFFNYGDVFVQTAGEKLHFDFLAVPKPAKAVDIIQNLIGGNHAE